MNLQIITLSNGKKVGNFSSPHSFTFTDGSVLPAVSNEESERLKILFLEKELNSVGDIELRFETNADVWGRMTDWMILQSKGLIDVVFCPLPMITSIKAEMTESRFLSLPFRSIRMEDRIKKLVSIDKQCI